MLLLNMELTIVKNGPWVFDGANDFVTKKIHLVCVAINALTFGALQNNLITVYGGKQIRPNLTMPSNNFCSSSEVELSLVKATACSSSSEEI